MELLALNEKMQKLPWHALPFTRPSLLTRRVLNTFRMATTESSR